MRVSGVSFSSDRKLSRCEQQYFYAYEEKLQKRVKSKGLYKGDWGHILLEEHYRTGKWREMLQRLITERWDKLFDEEKEEYGTQWPWELQALMEHYTEYWAQEDGQWTVLHLEKEFELMTKLGFPVRWKADLVVSQKIPSSNIRVIKSHNQTRNILIETKFKKAIPTSEERILQPQVHSYAYLLGKVGVPIHSIRWNYIKTEPVTRPQINKDGSVSVRKINTDRRSYLKAFNEAIIKPFNLESEEGLIDYNNYVNSLPETLSLERVTNTPNFKLGENFVKDWVERARRAMNIKRPLRSWNRNCKFDCDFYQLCQVDMLGKVDRNLVILKDYESKKKREELK